METDELPNVYSRIRRFIPLLVIALGLATFLALGLDRHLSLEALAEHQAWLARQVEQHAFLTAAAFMAVYAVAVALSVPGAIILTLMGGFLFGPATGTAYVVLAATLGAVAVFLAARTAFGSALRAKAGPRLARFVDGFRDDALSYLLVLRLVPVFPFWLVNLAAAILGVRLGTFVLATLFGIIPGSAVYASLGNSMRELLAIGATPDLAIVFDPVIFGPLLGLAALSLLPVLLRRHRALRRAAAAAAAEESGGTA